MTTPVRTRPDVLERLAAAEDEICGLGVGRLALFGSFARSEAGSKSDVDLLGEVTPARKSFDVLHFARGSTYLAAALLLGCSPADVQPQTPRVTLAGPQQAGEETLACLPGDTALFPSAHLQAREGWYGKHLRAAGEGRLCGRAGVEEAYRFTWLRTFHAPVVVRVEKRGGRYVLTAKQLDGAGGYEPGGLVANRTVQLGSGEWAHLRVLLDSAAFWSPGPMTEDPRIGLDGAQWILEGVHGHRYQAVDLWSPEETGPGRHIRAVGLYLLRIARLTPRDPRDVY